MKKMGTQLWWFYDALAVAIVLVCIFLTARKGSTRAVASLISSIIAMILALSLSSGVSGTVYKVGIRDNLVDKLTKSLIDNETTSTFKSYMEGLGYNVKINADKIDAIFDSGEDYDQKLCTYMNNVKGKKIESEEILTSKIREGYAEVFKYLVDKDVNRYAAEAAAEKIRNGEIKVEELFIRLRVVDASMKPAAVIICDEYLAAPYKDFIGIILFIVGFAVGYIICLILIKSMMTNTSQFVSTSSRIAGGVIGIFVGASFVFFAAALVRLSVIGGSNEMLFFNHEAINKTFVFKHLYDIVSKLG